MSSKSKLVQNYFYNVIYKVLAVFIPIVTTPYLARVLGAENIGIYSYSLSIVTYFILFGSLGVSMYGQREIAYVQNDIQKRSITFFEILFMKMLSLIVSLILFYIFFCANGQYSFYYKILILEIVANILDISWFFQGIENFKQVVIKNSIVRIISVICIFVFIKSNADLTKYFVIYVSSNLLGNLSFWINLKKYVKFDKCYKLNIFKHFKPALALLVPQIAMEIYTVLDKTMIGAIIPDKAEVGYYEQAQKMVKIALSIATSLGTVMMPRMSNIYASGNKEELNKYLNLSFSFVFLLAFPLTLGLISITPSFVPVYFGEGYDKVKILMIIISPIILAIGMSNIVGMQYMIPTKKQKAFTLSVVVGAVVNFVLNLILINLFNSIGASIATVIAEFAVTITQFILIRKNINIYDVVKITHKYFLASVVMFIGSVVVGYFINDNILSIGVQVIVSCILYFSMLIIMKDRMIFDAIKLLKSKIRK